MIKQEFQYWYSNCGQKKLHGPFTHATKTPVINDGREIFKEICENLDDCAVRGDLPVKWPITIKVKLFSETVIRKVQPKATVTYDYELAVVEHHKEQK